MVAVQNKMTTAMDIQHDLHQRRRRHVFSDASTIHTESLSDDDYSLDAVDDEYGDDELFTEKEDTMMWFEGLAKLAASKHGCNSTHHAHGIGGSGDVDFLADEPGERIWFENLTDKFNRYCMEEDVDSFAEEECDDGAGSRKTWATHPCHTELACGVVVSNEDEAEKAATGFGFSQTRTFARPDSMKKRPERVYPELLPDTDDFTTKSCPLLSDLWEINDLSEGSDEHSDFDSSCSQGEVTFHAVRMIRNESWKE